MRNGPYSRIYLCSGMLAVLCLLTVPLRAENVVQSFDTWPVTTTWGTYTNAADGWIISGGEIRGNRPGFGTPIPSSGQCGWLADTDFGTNLWLRSPLMPRGVKRLSFWCRRNMGSAGQNLFEIQTSTNGIEWIAGEQFDRSPDDWVQYSVDLNILDPVYVRIAKTADFSTNQYLGIDEVEIMPPPGVLLSDLMNDPPTPSVVDAVHVLARAEALEGSTIDTLRAWYRYGDSGTFTSIPMTNIGGTQYRTTGTIPSGHDGVVQYYVECTYSGYGTSPVFIPEAGSNGPSLYDTSNPYLTSSSRQLNPCTHRAGLIVSEIMYHAALRDGTNSLAYIELFNTDSVDIDLTGYRLRGDADFDFPDGTVMPARSFLVVARSPQSIVDHYGIGNVTGPLQDGLPDGGGNVRLHNRENALLLDIRYDDDPPWPVTADGMGHSLVLARPDYGERSVRAWAASRNVGGSPGVPDPTESTALDNVVINEFLAHTDPDMDVVELYNHGTQSVDLSGCWITDSPDQAPFQIPGGTVLAPLGFVYFTEFDLGFRLSMSGDDIYLANPDQTRVLDGVRFEGQQNGVSTGRYPDGAPAFHELTAPTIGEANTNAALNIRTVVINEIMYHPITGNDDHEYIELHNRSGGAEDVGYWRFADGIDFTLPPGTVIPAGGYLVVAKDTAALISRYPQLDASNTVGDYGGALSDRGERVVLAKPDDLNYPYQDFVIVDEVTYDDGRDWGRWTDGGGSSLELTDPHSDNRLAMNWAGSDETSKADWTTVDYTGTIDHGSGARNELRVFYQAAGESLLDNVEVFTEDGPAYLASDFEGSPSWSPSGNHVRSSLETGEGYLSSQSLHLRASGMGNHGTWSGWGEPFWNRVAAVLYSDPPENAQVTIRAKARWLAGWPVFAMGLKGHWMEASVILDVPENLGSPGQANSRAVANAGPALSDVAHTPVLPAAGQPVAVSCRVHDPDGLISVVLDYRVFPATAYTQLPMNDAGTDGDSVAGDGVFGATIPAQDSGKRVAFVITASDAAVSPVQTRFPEDPPVGAPAKECIVRFGDTVNSGAFGTYLMWIGDENLSRWTTISGGSSKYSNEPIDVTLVIHDYRAIYSAGARWRGLWRPYGNPLSAGAYSVEMSKSDRFLGDSEIKLDAPGQSGSDVTRQAEAYCLWLAHETGIAASRMRSVNVKFNGSDRGVMNDLQVPSLDFCESWFLDGDPEVYKDVGWFGEPFDVYKDGFDEWKQSRYRWNLRKRKTNVPNDDYGAVYHVAEASEVVDDLVYEKRMRAMLDIRGWCSYFAVNGAIAGWDSYGWDYCHNMYVYIPRDRQSYMLLCDMDYTLAGGGGLFPLATWPVPHRMANYPAFRRVYMQILKELVDGPMTDVNTAARLDTVYSAFAANGLSAASPSGIKTWIAGRRPVLLSTVAPGEAPFAITTAGGAGFSTNTPILSLSGTAPIDVATIRVNGRPHDVLFPSLTAWSLRTGLHQGPNPLLVEGLDWRGSVLASNSIEVTLTDVPPSPTGQLVISEIMYHPATPNGEYIEIFNRSATDSFDLAGWRINGADLTFEGGSIIEPRAYAVVAGNLSAYQHTYGNAEFAMGDFSGSLDNGGETLQLLRPEGSNAWVVVDEVTYDDDPPWPAEADGQGQALQLLDPDADNNRPGNWGTVDMEANREWTFVSVTGVSSNNSRTISNAMIQVYLDGPGTVFIDNVSLVQGSVPEQGMNLIDNGDFEAPLAGFWNTDGSHAASRVSTAQQQTGVSSLLLEASGPGGTSGNSVNQGSLGLQVTTTYTLSYWYLPTADPVSLTLWVEQSSVGTTHPATIEPPELALYTPGDTNSIAQALPPFPALTINEVLASNVNGAVDNYFEPEPWIELYNADTVTVDLAGMCLSDDYLDLDKWAFPTGTTLATGSYMVVWADADTNQTDLGHLHAGFRLNPAGGAVALAKSHLETMVLIDHMNYGDLGADTSLGCYPDGDRLNHVILHNPSPGTANSQTSQLLQVVINEWMADNESTILDPTDNNFEDWFEIYNPGIVAANLGGYVLRDHLPSPASFTIPPGTFVPAEGFLFVWADSDTQDNAPGEPLHAGFKLGKNGDGIDILAPDAALVDSVSFGPQRNDITEGRWPDADPRIYALHYPTPEAPNVPLRAGSAEQPSIDTFRVTWEAIPHAVYFIERSDGLTPTNWQQAGIVTAQNEAAWFDDPTPEGATQTFYRVILDD